MSTICSHLKKIFADWEKESITEPRPTMAISIDDLHDIGTGLQKLEDFIPKILCHSVRNEFAVGKKHALKTGASEQYNFSSQEKSRS